MVLSAVMTASKTRDLMTCRLHRSSVCVPWQEFDVAVEGATPAERLAKQRRSLRKRLGMGGKIDELMETDSLIKDEDLLVAERPSAVKPGKGSMEAAELLTNMEGARAVPLAFSTHHSSAHAQMGYLQPNIECSMACQDRAAR